MPTSDPTDILLAHDKWATQQILNACAALIPEKFHHRFEMGPGSLHDTTTHILGAMGRWADLLAGREMRLMPEGTDRTVPALLTMLDEVHADFVTHVKTHPLDGTVTRVRDGKSYTFTRGAVLTHVATHSMHHRAQCLNMLRHLGVAPLPPSSVMEWTIMADSKR